MKFYIFIFLLFFSFSKAQDGDDDYLLSLFFKSAKTDEKNFEKVKNIAHRYKSTWTKISPVHWQIRFDSRLEYNCLVAQLIQLKKFEIKMEEGREQVTETLHELPTGKLKTN